MNRRATILFLSLGVAWGIPYLLIKVAVGELSPAMLVLARTALAAVLLLPIALWRGEVRQVLRRWPALLAFTVAEIALPWIFLGRAEQQLPSSTTGLLISAVPIVGVAVALLTGRAERLGLLGWLGILVGCLGVAALVGLDVGGSDLGSVAELVVVVVGYAVGPAILSRFLADLPSLGVIAVALGAAAIGYLPIVLLSSALPARMPSGKVIASVLLLAVVCTALAFVLLFALIGELGPVRATTITYVNPAVAMIAGAIFLSEAITVWKVLGLVLVLLGSYLVTKRPSPAAESAAGLVEAVAEPDPVTR